MILPIKKTLCCGTHHSLLKCAAELNLCYAVHNMLYLIDMIHNLLQAVERRHENSGKSKRRTSRKPEENQRATEKSNYAFLLLTSHYFASSSFLFIV